MLLPCFKLKNLTDKCAIMKTVHISKMHFGA